MVYYSLFLFKGVKVLYSLNLMYEKKDSEEKEIKKRINKNINKIFVTFN